MTRPGDRLRAMAARVCSATTMERLIDPLVADMQTEYAEAVRQGRVWRGRWVRIAGYVAMLKVLVFFSWEVAMRTLDGIIADHDRTTWRLIGWTVSATVIMMALLAIWPLLNLASEVTRLSDGDRTKLLLYLVPQALVVAVPIGITIGILGGFSGRASSRQLKRTVLVIAFGCSVASLGAIAWIVPASNQAFRVTIAGRNISKGFSELTLGEIGQQIVRAEKHGDVDGEPNSRQLAIAYHSRWAFSFATFVLALFGLAIVRSRSAGRTILGVAACVLYFAYYLGPSDVTELSRAGSLPAFAIAWFPNVVLAVTSVAVITVRLKADTTYESRSA
jgi:lipopolysaccharide export LptBFGC system permease protein LptF